MPVYIIQAGDMDRVKIGWAGDPVSRLNDLQTAHYEPLRIIRIIDTNEPGERWMHQRFVANHIRREWYHLHPGMMTVKVPEIVDGRLAVLRGNRGQISRLARGLGITKAAVSMWLQVPAERLPDVERITGIPRHELRPDICLPPKG